MRDYYEILGVSKDADANSIKKAYRKVAMKYHPDKNQGDKGAEENFKEAAEAYGILNDGEKRQRYDQFGHAGVNQSAGGGFHNMDMNDIFSSFGDIFGGGGGSIIRFGRGWLILRRLGRRISHRFNSVIGLSIVFFTCFIDHSLEIFLFESF